MIDLIISDGKTQISIEENGLPGNTHFICLESRDFSLIK